MKTVAKAFFHRFGTGQIGLCLDGAVGGVDLDGFTVVMFAFVSVDYIHCRGRDIIDDKPLQLKGRVGDGIEIDIIRADPAVVGQHCQFGSEHIPGFRLGGLERKTKPAHGLKDRRFPQRAVHKQICRIFGCFFLHDGAASPLFLRCQ